MAPQPPHPRLMMLARPGPQTQGTLSRNPSSSPSPTVSHRILAWLVPSLLALALLPTTTAQTETTGLSIDAVLPEFGPPRTYVTLEGNDFARTDDIYVGATPVTYDWYSPYVVGFYIPAIADGTYPITVHGLQGEAELCCFEVGSDLPTETPDEEIDETPEPEPEPTQPTTEGCTSPGQNMQCTSFGSIRMDSHRQVRGETVELTATVVLDTAYIDRNARWIMFSARNFTTDGPSPVTIQVERLASAFGDLVTTRVEQPKPSQINLWIDVLDIPLGTPISWTMQVGSTERGAFQLEALVMAFDRSYEPMIDAHGTEASLFSFTMLGVNKETGAIPGGGKTSILDGHKVPAPPVLSTLIALAAATLILRRRTA